MALTVRTNGSAGINIIQASWFNDFYNLLTGAMADQPVTLKPNATLQAIAGPPAAPALGLAAGTNLGIGGYQYAVTYTTADGGETLIGTTASVTTTSGNQSVSVTAIPTGPSGTAGRNLYRTKVGGAVFFRVTSIANNSTTTYTDSLADTGLTILAPAHPSFGGSLVFKDSSGATTLTISSDGSLLPSSGTTSFGGILFNGKLGVVTASDTLAADGFDTFLRARGMSNTIHLQDGNFVDYLAINNNGLSITPAHTSTPSAIIVGSPGIGIKTSGGTKLVEVNGSGNMNLRGSFAYSQGTAGFDSFDLAESYTSDADYPYGTIVCMASPTASLPADPSTFNPGITQCTHPGCALAMVVSKAPGGNAGRINSSAFPDYDNTQPITLPTTMVGRILVKASTAIVPGSYVCSDGAGGVRQVVTGDKVYALGTTFSAVTNGYVAVLARPTYIAL